MQGNLSGGLTKVYIVLDTILLKWNLLPCVIGLRNLMIGNNLRFWLFLIPRNPHSSSSQRKRNGVLKTWVNEDLRASPSKNYHIWQIGTETLQLIWIWIGDINTFDLPLGEFWMCLWLRPTLKYWLGYLLIFSLAKMYPHSSPLCFRGCSLRWECPKIRRFYNRIFSLF